MDRVTNEAWVTLCTNDVYAVGALVLASSLQRVGSTRQKAVLVGPNLSLSMRERLSEVFDWVEDVDVLDSHDSAHLALMARPELGVTFTKMHCWKLIQYEKAVFLDADTLVLRNCDELFDREEFSAAPDAGWPDCFNTGVFVYTPSLETYHNLLQFAVDHGSFDGGDQGLLNLYFSEWATGDIMKRLPFVYNMSATSVYTYLPAYRQFGRDVRIVHFLGTKKPWQCTDAASSQAVPYSQDHLNSWWHIFREDVQRLLSLDMSRDAQIPLLLTSAFAQYVEDKHVVAQAREREAPPTLVTTYNTYQYYHHQTPSTSLPPPAQIETPPTRREWEESSPSPAPLASSSASSPVEVGMHAQEVVETCSGYDWFTPELETESGNVPEVERDQQRQPLLLLLPQPRQEQVAHEPETVESATEAPSPASMPKNPNPSSAHMSEAHDGVVATMSALSVGEAATVSSNLVNNEERSLLQNRGHREAWERGEIDYRGRDSFDSIMAKINETLRRSASKESVPILAE